MRRRAKLLPTGNKSTGHWLIIGKKPWNDIICQLRWREELGRPEWRKMLSSRAEETPLWRGHLAKDTSMEPCTHQRIWSLRETSDCKAQIQNKRSQQDLCQQQRWVITAGPLMTDQDKQLNVRSFPVGRWSPSLLAMVQTNLLSHASR